MMEYAKDQLKSEQGS